ncbi:rhamnogalacturonyl hydrolase YesR [Paenibacillus harenae]|nr:rhamnogalacturonyl hydrolase YesR [Paenibacillus harenae]
MRSAAAYWVTSSTPPRYSPRNLLIALTKYPDAASGLWYQVVDKADRPDNWRENSCTALYVHAIAKAVRTVKYRAIINATDQSRFLSK